MLGNSGKSKGPGPAASSKSALHSPSKNAASRASMAVSGPVENTEDSFNLKAKITLLEKDLERRQESYISRERAYKTRIDELEEELNRQKNRKSGWMKADSKMGSLKLMQHQIVENVELVQDRTAHILQEQERDLLRAFRARLFDVQTELEKEKGKKDDGAGAWIEKCRQLEAEVEWAKEVADRLERVNQNLVAESTRVKAQFASQEEDRNHLIKQLVAVKKDNSTLRTSLSNMERDLELLEQEKRKIQEEGALSMGGVGGLPTTLPRSNSTHLGSKSENEERQKEDNRRLRRLLEDQGRQLKQCRENYAAELRARTEMEMLLRSCVEDVRIEIQRKKLEEAVVPKNRGKSAQQNGMISPLKDSRPMTGEGAGGPQLSSIGHDAYMRLYSKSGTANNPLAAEHFTKADRERVLELLLSQERVVTLLYAKTFPVGGRANSSAHPLSPDGSPSGGGPATGMPPQQAGGGTTTLPHLPGAGARDVED